MKKLSRLFNTLLCMLLVLTFCCNAAAEGVAIASAETGAAETVDPLLRALETAADGWIQVEGDWYYVRNGEYVKNIVMTIGDARYGFDDKGKMYAGSRFWCMDENGTWYYFAAKSNGKLYANEWYIGEYYMDENGRSVMGLYAVNGVLYYFEANYGGQLVRNTTVNVDGQLYTVDENGVAKLQGVGTEGWNQVGDDWYYVRNGEYVKSIE